MTQNSNSSRLGRVFLLPLLYKNILAAFFFGYEILHYGNISNLFNQSPIATLNMAN
jgi:hypothetical protein